MHPNAQLIQNFYTCFQALDTKGMCACYHPDIVFTDPAFGRLEGGRANAMWEMLCGRATDLKITFDNIKADDQTGSAHWEAWYSFGKESRKVHNIIDASFVFQDGLIVKHTDRFGIWRWSRMALGPVGILLGWTPFISGRVRRTALNGLEKYLANQMK